MKKILFISVLVALGLTGCDQDLSQEELDIFLQDAGFVHEKTPAMEVTSLDFSQDDKTFTLATRMVSDFGPYNLADSTAVRIVVKESVNGILQHRFLPRLTAVRNTEAQKLAASGIRVLALVDLTLPPADIDLQHTAVTEMLTSFRPENLYVSFFYGDSISAPLQATNYVMRNYFHRKETDHKLLYRAILQQKQTMESGQAPWDKAAGRLLVVFSDEKVYLDDDAPMDPEHFDLQQQLLLPDGGAVEAFYVSMSQDAESQDDNSSGILQLFCQNHQGLFLQGFNWVTVKNAFFGRYGLDVSTYEFDFLNPDYKVYRGNRHHLTLDFFSTAADSLVSSVTAQIRKGTIYDPVIVHGRPIGIVILQGCILAFLILALVWLVFQFMVPFIRYRLFLRHHVVTYRGPLMSTQNHLLGQTCYLCKAPFQEGDRVVVKCRHSMHKHCWDENDYHCPEHGSQCPEGSHFYNHHNLLDARNATFYLPWLLGAIGAALLAWIVFLLWAHYSSSALLEDILRWMNLITDADSHQYINEFAEHEKLLPAFGLFISFFLTLAFAALAMYSRNVRRKWLSILLRAILAGLCSMMLFVLTAGIEAVFDFEAFFFLLEWIPWILTAFVIAYASTIHTRIHLKSRRLLLAAVVALLTMHAWSFFILDARIDFRVFLLISFLVFAVGLAICVAQPVSRSHCYFLRVEGPVKTMEIALYKWFAADPSSVVTIGKSVDCNLQLSWDIIGSVAPVHAEIRKKQDALYLIPLEPGVTAAGQSLPVGRSTWLYQDASFTIGNTTFTYIEKDFRH